MKPVKAWAIVDERSGQILTVANQPRTFMDHRDAADEVWRYRVGSKVVRVEIREVKRKKKGKQ